VSGEASYVAWSQLLRYEVELSDFRYQVVLTICDVPAPVLQRDERASPPAIVVADITSGFSLLKPHWTA
jgi:hypothetical protein